MYGDMASIFSNFGYAGIAIFRRNLARAEHGGADALHGEVRQNG